MTDRVAAEIWRAGERVDVRVPSKFRLCDRCERRGGDYRAVSPTPVETDDARHDAWAAYLARWSLSYPCHLHLSCVKGTTEDGRGYYLRVQFEYPDERDSRDGATLVPPGTGLWPPSLYPDEDTPRWIRANLLYHLQHELDEHLQLDGKRVFDPHVDAVYYCDRCEPRGDG